MSMCLGDDPAGSPGYGIISPMWIFGTPEEFTDPRRHVPDLHGRAAARGEVSPVRAVRQLVDEVLVPAEGRDLPTRLGVPEPHRPVIAGRGELSTAGVERHGRDAICMPLKAVEQPAVFRVAESYGLIREPSGSD